MLTLPLRITRRLSSSTSPLEWLNIYSLEELPTSIPPTPSGDQVVNREVTQYLKKSSYGAIFNEIKMSVQHQEL